MLQLIGSQRVRHDLATEQQQQEVRIGWGPEWLHSYKGTRCDHKVAAGRWCSADCWCCPWGWHGSKQVQVIDGAATCLRADP